MLLDPLQARQLLTHAMRNRYAILAVNADSPAAIVDTIEAARRCDAPVIVEASLWQLEGHSFGAGDARLGLTRYLADLAVLGDSKAFRDIPVIFHTDHIKGPLTRELLATAIRGVELRLTEGGGIVTASTISLDASELPHDENIGMLRWLAGLAERSGSPATFEMEDAVDHGFTPIERAKLFVGSVEETHPGYVWMWAPALGTQHGLTQGGESFDGDLALAHVDALRELTGRDIGLVLHGTSGMDDGELQRAVQAGVIKTNWSSELLNLRSETASRYYHEVFDSITPGSKEWKPAAMDTGLQAFISAEAVPAIERRIRLLGGAGQAAPFRDELTKIA